MVKKIRVFAGGQPILTARVAETFASRLVGLLNKKTLPENEGLLIRPCRQIHTFFMRFAIDAVFLTAENRISGIERNISKGKISGYYKNACSVLETAAGVAEKAGLMIGSILKMEEVEQNG